MRTYAPAGLGLSFSIPSDWVGASGRSTGPVARFEGSGPARLATLEVYSTKTRASLDALAPGMEAALRKDFPHGAFTARPGRVGPAVPALVMTIRYRGVWTRGVGQITRVIFFFVHGGAAYEFDFMAVAPYTSKYLPAFAASAASIRFR